MHIGLLPLLALMGWLLAIPAAWAQQPAQSTSSKSGASAAGKAGSSRDTAPQVDGARDRIAMLRQQIAVFLEGHKWFREHDPDGAPKLKNTAIAGPLEIGGLLSPKRETYCIKAQVMLTTPFLFVDHDWLVAMVKVVPTEDGRQKLEGRMEKATWGPDECMYVKDARFTSFSELDRLRANRRRALGKLDP